MSKDESPLRPRLDRAKSQLKSALEEVCNEDVDDADTGELIRVEEALAIANNAAKEAISVRRRLHQLMDDSGSEAPGTTSRDVKDANGVRWTIFAVHPSAAHRHAPLPEPFQSGWLAFDAGNETRRLAPIPEAWEGMSDRELLALWQKAEVARRRRPPRQRPTGGG